MKKTRSFFNGSIKTALSQIAFTAVVLVGFYGIGTYVSADPYTFTVNTIGYGSREWYALAASTDATKIVVAEYGGYIYTSSDSGATWTARTGAGERYWYAAASSADGSKLAVVDYTGWYNDTRYIYTSSDSGATWTARTGAGSRYWTKIESSSDGSILLATEQEGNIYRSTDSGVTWTVMSALGAQNWYDVAMSNSGANMAAIHWNGVFVSTTTGATWADRTAWIGYVTGAPSTFYPCYSVSDPWGCWNLSDVAVAQDGSKGVIIMGGYIYIAPTFTSASVASGRWVRNNMTPVSGSVYGNGTWSKVKMAGSSGSVILVSGYPTAPAISTNGGTTWANITVATMTWSEIALGSSRMIGIKAGSRLWGGPGRGGYIDVSTSHAAASPFNEYLISKGHIWESVVASASSTKLLAGDSDDYLSTSVTSGTSWTQRTGTGRRSWNNSGLASSVDGVKLYAVDGYGTGIGSGGYLYRSADSGATWASSTSAGVRRWWDITTSSDGTKVYATVDYDYIYKSTDSGVTWASVPSAGSGNWGPIAVSSDGTKIFVGPNYEGYLKTSTNSGTSWTDRTGAGQHSWLSVASSADGSTLAALDTGGYVYVSTSSGATWTQPTNIGGGWEGEVVVSSNGLKMAAASGGYIYSSPDSGVTWTANTSSGSRYWYGLAMSSIGATTTKLYAAGSSDYGVSSASIYQGIEQDDKCAWVGSYPPLLTITSPAPSASIAAGASFQIQGSFRYHNTSAAAGSSTLRWVNHDGTQTGTVVVASSTATCSGGGCPHSNTTTNFSLATFSTPAITAPSTGGTYRFYVYASSTNACTTDATSGYRDYVVSQAGVCGTKHASPTLEFSSSNPVTGTDCTVGTITNTSTVGETHSWQCAGVGAGTTSAACSYIYHNPVNGLCPSDTTSNACTAGTVTGSTGSEEAGYTWTCQGSYGGSNASCSSIPESGTLSSTFWLNSPVASMETNLCAANWTVTSTSPSLISCNINGESVGNSGSNYPVVPGLKTLRCIQGTASTTKSARCTSNPDFRER